MISTHTPHVGCDDIIRATYLDMFISTHTPHVGCDPKNLWYYLLHFISTHTPHVGCDGRFSCTETTDKISTHTPHVGCDVNAINLRVEIANFNSHTPCGVRPRTLSKFSSLFGFQLTHPMWGATYYSAGSRCPPSFQLTHPMWGAT